MLAGCAALLSLAAWIHPEASGLGSHEQLGLPPCSLVTVSGLPCPTCGMTTAFAHAVRGELLAALAAQPAGLLLAVGTMATAGIALSVVIAGRTWRIRGLHVAPGAVMTAVAVLLLGGWACKLAVFFSVGARH